LHAPGQSVVADHLLQPGALRAIPHDQQPVALERFAAGERTYDNLGTLIRHESAGVQDSYPLRLGVARRRVEEVWVVSHLWKVDNAASAGRRQVLDGVAEGGQDRRGTLVGRTVPGEP